MKDEIAQAIANELRLIREELQRLTGAIKSSANRSGNSYAGNSRKSYQARSVSARVWPTERAETTAEPTRRGAAKPVASSKRYEMSEGLMKLLAARKVAVLEGNLEPSTSNPGKRFGLRTYLKN